MVTNLKQLKSKFIQSYRGQAFFNLLASLYDFLSLITWSFNKKGIISRNKIRKLKDKYKGKRCFIIGNGPSLKKTDLTRLKNEYTFGLNRIYLLFDDLGFTTNFLVSVNNLVLNQVSESIKNIKTNKFISWKARRIIDLDKKTIYLRTIARQHFSKNLVKGVWEGATVTFVAMQIAYYLGFDKIILIGVDHFFKTKGQAHKEVVSRGNDKDHFSKKYFGNGFRWNLPDLKTSEYAFKMARKTFENDGREIYNATIGGKLKVFKYVNYEDLFKKRKQKMLGKSK